MSEEKKYGPLPRQLFIDGEFVAGAGAVVEARNPATEEVFAEFRGASPDQVRQAIGAARRAFDEGGWASQSPGYRVAALRRFIQHLTERSAAIVDHLVLETGCPRSSMTMMVQLAMPLRSCLEYLDLYLSLPDVVENPLSFNARMTATGAVLQSIRRYVPLGVVSAISAYNFPLFMGLWKAIPALATGNSVVLRPSPLTPMSSLVFGEAAIAAGLPPGVLNIVTEAGAEGAMIMTSDPGVNMITFTGSSDVGEKVMAQAARGIKRIQLELGGKSAQIFLPDRVEAAAGVALSVCLAHAGQGCVLGTRVFVPAAEKQAVLEKLAASLTRVTIGDPNDPAIQMGPVISAAQRDRCERYVKAAIDAGGKVVFGGKRPAHLNRGYFFEPTVLDLPDNKNPAAQDEIFGPVLGVIGYESVDHAVEMANDSVYGLSGYVFGKDTRKAVEVACRLKTGTVNVNGGSLSPFISSGGWGRSGIGRERGEEGLRMYQEIQVLNITN
ncbi:MAG: aldehyde dehydrogenase [Hydrocarboniphaga sp.]|uniref:aldehyde dehydrogenase family protein n=1 Tax=Hydrocarboniphaga sp. TaxID=2033016 RepID=UPI002619EE86|nr:aldehyde dehydrogenase family protein [Hydrocarboniphaga sp.]MDB5968494.1 aldehyde dehydrogenase [Hydrocarboniphaga sp.]